MKAVRKKIVLVPLLLLLFFFIAINTNNASVLIQLDSPIGKKLVSNIRSYSFSSKINSFSPPSVQIMTKISSVTSNGQDSNFGIYNDNELNSYNLSITTELLETLLPATAYISDMVFDGSGNIIVLAGFQNSSVNPVSLAQLITSTGNEITTSINPYAGLILKFDPNFNLLYGSILYTPMCQYSYYNSLALDLAGNFYIMGMREILTNGHDRNVQLIKMDPNFNVLNFTVMGGTNEERVGIDSTAIAHYSEGLVNNYRTYPLDDLMAIDSSGNIIITGSTKSSNFPVIGSNSQPHSGPAGTLDCFVTKLDSNLNIVWSTLYGDTGEEQVGAVAIDSNDRVYIGGITKSSSLPLGTSYPQQDQLLNGSQDAFIAAFESNGLLHTATYLGGSSNDFLYAMVIDAQDNPIVAGETYGPGFPIAGGGIYNQTYPHSLDTSFITYYDKNDWSIPFSTRIVVGDARSAITDLALATTGSLYFSGVTNYFGGILPNETLNSIFPTTGPYADHTLNGTNVVEQEDRETFAGILDTNKNLVFNSYTDYEKVADQYQKSTHRAKILLNNTGDDFLLGLEGTNLGLFIKTFSIVDSDNDGLSDYNEANVYGSDPLLADTDHDGLTDEEEVHTYLTDPTKTDTDNDCINDTLEVQYGLNPIFPDSNLDSDNDGLSAFEEILYGGTDPNNNDTDADGLYDYEELYVYFTNGAKNDSDQDNLLDLEEIALGFDPNNPDMDNDGLFDGTEYIENYPINATHTAQTDPFDPDSDNDELLDGLEVALGLNPLLIDTDGDQLSDAEEYLRFASDPTLNDTDGDGLNDTEELVIYFTNVTLYDTDFDDLNDSAEILIFNLDPWDNDTDDDGLADGAEIIHGTDPLVADIDKDGLTDAQEVNYGSDPYSNDSDADGLPDFFEFSYGLNSSFDESQLDLDGDNLTTIMEFHNKTNPLLNDTDFDLLDDLFELQEGLDPNNNDTDFDSLTDPDELFIFETSPKLYDSDLDGLSDGNEILLGTNAINWDSDSDFLSDFDEIFLYNSSPLNNDSDSDLLSDSYEVVTSLTNPTLNDSDIDGLSDFIEIFRYSTDPNDPDSDADGLIDSEEIFYSTDPNDPDSDDDNLIDGLEVKVYHSKPNLNDSDLDGLLDGSEVLIYGSDPTSNDTDSDLMPDGWEAIYLLKINTNDTSEDPDNDGLVNLFEYTIGTDPTNPDSDGDGQDDGWEVSNGRDPLDPTERDGGNVINQLVQNPQIAIPSTVALLAALAIMGEMFYSWLKKTRGASNGNQ